MGPVDPLTCLSAWHLFWGLQVKPQWQVAPQGRALLQRPCQGSQASTSCIGLLKGLALVELTSYGSDGRKKQHQIPPLIGLWLEPSTATVRNQCTSTRLTDYRRRKLYKTSNCAATQMDCDSRKDVRLALCLCVSALSRGEQKVCRRYSTSLSRTNKS